jgi:ATP-dependent helicase/nuclease subunit B
MVDQLRLDARACGTSIAPPELARILRESMDEVAVRPPYGGHPRVSIYGLLEARMARADLVICAGLNEGSWPQVPSPDPLLAPGVLRTLGVPGPEFRIGLAAHDLAGAMGAPEVVLSRAQRDADGPTMPSRFWLRVEALLGESLAKAHREREIPCILPLLDRAPEPAPRCLRPAPRPPAKLRRVEIHVTALDRLLGDPYQFYARTILRLGALDALGVDPFADPALRGELVHAILEKWHTARAHDPALALRPFAENYLRAKQVHPLFRGLWEPRILAALERFEGWVREDEAAGRHVMATETRGSMVHRGVTITGRADRIDRMPDGSLAIVDYKTGAAPTRKEVAKGYRLQLGLLGLIARDGSFRVEDESVSGDAGCFEYWSLNKHDGEFGERFIPMRLTDRQSGLAPDEFLPRHEDKLDEAIDRYIRGDEPFRAKENPDYPGYTEYDQLMRLEEWIVTLGEDADERSSDARSPAGGGAA